MTTPTTPPPGFHGDDATSSANPNGPTGRADTDAPAVAGLAREVEQLRRLLDTLTPQIGELSERVDSQAQTVVQLAELIRRQNPQPGEVTSWLALPDGTEHARRVLAGLADWVQQIYLRYPDARGLPECWLWHPDVVEELCWLQQIWETAYGEDAATPGLAADFHDRYRPGVVRRIQTSAGTCSLAAHQPRDGRHRLSTPPRVPLAEAVDDIAAWWGDHRDQPAPEPTVDQLTAAEDYLSARDHHPRERGPR